MRKGIRRIRQGVGEGKKTGREKLEVNFHMLCIPLGDINIANQIKHETIQNSFAAIY